MTRFCPVCHGPVGSVTSCPQCSTRLPPAGADAEPWTVGHLDHGVPFIVGGVFATGEPFFLRSRGDRAVLTVAPATFPRDSLHWPYWPPPALMVDSHVVTYTQAAEVLRWWWNHHTRATG